MPFCLEWQHSNAHVALQNLAEFLWDHQMRPKQAHLMNAFWQERPAQMMQVINWLTDPATLEYFQGKMTSSEAWFADEALASIVEWFYLLWE